MYACVKERLCAYTRSVGGVSRVSHRNICKNHSAIKEPNYTMESEKDGEKKKKHKRI